MSASKDASLFEFPSIEYSTFYNINPIMNSLEEKFTKTEAPEGYQEKWACGDELNAYTIRASEGNRLRIEGSSTEKINDLFQELRGIMKKKYDIKIPYNEGVISISPGKKDTKDCIHFIGEYGNFISESKAKPDPNTATEMRLLTLAKEKGSVILPGGMTTRQVLGLASSLRTGFPSPPPGFSGNGIKYLVIGPVSISGTVNKVLDTYIELKDVSKDRYFVNVSIYDNKLSLIKGFQRESYDKKFLEAIEKPLTYIT